MRRDSDVTGPKKFSANRKCKRNPVGYRRHNLRRRSLYDRSQGCLEPDSIERSSPDAASASMAGSALVPHIYDRDYANGGWLALVCAGSDSIAVWWRLPFLGSWGRKIGCRVGNFPLSHDQTLQPPPTTLRN